MPGPRVVVIPYTPDLPHLAWSPDRTHLARASASHVVINHVQSGKIVRCLYGGQDIQQLVWDSHHIRGIGSKTITTWSIDVDAPIPKTNTPPPPHRRHRVQHATNTVYVHGIQTRPRKSIP